MAKAIRYINRNDAELAGTPCACDRETGVIFINPEEYRKLTRFQRKFWIWHEKGHINLNTADEIAADNYAFDHLAGTQFRSLKQMIEAAEGLLNSGSPYHQERIDNLYRRALEWDAAHPVQPINKATSKQITALGTQMNNAILNMTTAMMGQTQVVQSGTQTQSTNNNMLLIAVIAILLIVMLLKK